MKSARRDLDARSPLLREIDRQLAMRRARGDATFVRLPMADDVLAAAADEAVADGALAESVKPRRRAW